MKPRSERIKVVIDLARRAEDEAAQNLAQAQQQLAAEQQRLADLADYYESYVEQRKNMQAGVIARDLEKMRVFLQQLGGAREAQSMQVTRVEKVVEQQKENWRVVHMKHKKLQELAEKFRQEENRMLDKKEQKMLDEWINTRQGR